MKTFYYRLEQPNRSTRYFSVLSDTEHEAHWLVVDESDEEICFVAKLDNLANIPEESIEYLKGKK